MVKKARCAIEEGEAFQVPEEKKLFVKQKSLKEFVSLRVEICLL